MQDSTRISVAPKFGVNGPRPGKGGADPKKFHFAVTWRSVTAHLSLIEAADFKPASRAAAASAMAVAPQVHQPPVQHEAKARWEMVVPKMDRVNRTPQPVLTGADDYPAPAIPAMLALPVARPAPFLSRALAVMGMRGGASQLQVLQLNAASPANPPEKAVNQRRELLLSKITKSLRSRAQEAASL
ncbi:MAG: hypothetical protein M3O20_14090 [Acidobacteriota bacterium]|nr:hypothetical protein [Acidobacteriota bacterium]